MKSFTYNFCSRLIKASRTEDMANMLDVFFAAKRITEEEYFELIDMVQGGTN